MEPARPPTLPLPDTAPVLKLLLMMPLAVRLLLTKPPASMPAVTAPVLKLLLMVPLLIPTRPPAVISVPVTVPVL